jgi:hypothetical protein
VPTADRGPPEHPRARRRRWRQSLVGTLRRWTTESPGVVEEEEGEAPILHSEHSHTATAATKARKTSWRPSSWAPSAWC